MAKIKIKEEKVFAKKHSVLKEIHYDQQKQNGEWEEQTRDVFSHGNAVTVLLYNKENKTVLLTKQFRLPTYVNGNSSGILIETCAGLLEENEQPEEAVIREVKEETGYQISGVQKVCAAYSSPGVFTEQVHYFVAPYKPEQKKAPGGGLAEEGEDVKVLELPFEKALQMVDSGEIKDAKTILLLYYVLANKLLSE